MDYTIVTIFVPSKTTGKAPARPRPEVQRQALYNVGQVASSGVELHECQQRTRTGR